MKAIVQNGYGSLDALKLREVETPAPGDGEVLVRVRAASVHPDVWHVVSGRPYILRLMGAGFFKPKNPIPGYLARRSAACSGSTVAPTPSM
jgi:NADPH:quinone reductase-like Zn-dependent oxidoreductase